MGYKGESYMDTGYFYVPYPDLENDMPEPKMSEECKKVLMMIEDKDKVNELLDVVQKYVNELREETLHMTHKERYFLLHTLVEAISLAKDGFKEAVDAGRGDEV